MRLRSRPNDLFQVDCKLHRFKIRGQFVVEKSVFKNFCSITMSLTSSTSLGYLEGKEQIVLLSCTKSMTFFLSKTIKCLQYVNKISVVCRPTGKNGSYSICRELLQL